MAEFSRVWAMPSRDTFSIPPIKRLVERYAATAEVSVDPFARNSRLATLTNDLDPNTAATHHMDAVDYLAMLADLGIVADAVFCDPPYSPRQIADCYAAARRTVTAVDTQNARLMKSIREGIRKITTAGSVVLSFGWNSAGMGKGWLLEELMLVFHGGAHNDTICMVERRG